MVLRKLINFHRFESLPELLSHEVGAGPSAAPRHQHTETSVEVLSALCSHHFIRGFFEAVSLLAKLD